MDSSTNGTPSDSSDYPPRVPADRMSAAEFICSYLIPNQPVIITNATKNWKVADKFLNEDGTPNFNCLLREFGELTVPITICSTGKTEKCKFSAFIEDFKKNPMTDRYLRDWHLVSDTNDYSWYSIPRFCADDWVNARPSVAKENVFGGDYRFCYMGGSGTKTGFHSDVFNSYSWSANICGQKTWFMMPVGADRRLSQSETEMVDLSQDPKFFEVGGFRFEQLPGEIVFVPSEFYHQVHNQGFTISINHNWINSFNLDRVFGLLFERLDAAKREVRLLRAEVSNHADLVEHFLRMDYGLNLQSAIKLCECILSERLPPQTISTADELVRRCTCLTADHLSFICSSCHEFTAQNDQKVAQQFLSELTAKLEELQELDWISDREE